MEMSKISSKGQVTIPKSIRDRLELSEGDRIVFLEENGRIILSKASLTALTKLQNSINEEAKSKRIAEEEVQYELKTVRKEIWNERNR